jgi:hypothetical protein
MQVYTWGCWCRVPFFRIAEGCSGTEIKGHLHALRPVMFVTTEEQTRRLNELGSHLWSPTSWLSHDWGTGNAARQDRTDLFAATNARFTLELPACIMIAPWGKCDLSVPSKGSQQQQLSAHAGCALSQRPKKEKNTLCPWQAYQQARTMCPDAGTRDAIAVVATSGSTGPPKYVVLGAVGVLHRLAWHSSQPLFNQRSRFECSTKAQRHTEHACGTDAGMDSSQEGQVTCDHAAPVRKTSSCGFQDAPSAALSGADPEATKECSMRVSIDGNSKVVVKTSVQFVDSLWEMLAPMAYGVIVSELSYLKAISTKGMLGCLFWTVLVLLFFTSFRSLVKIRLTNQFHSSFKERVRAMHM